MSIVKIGKNLVDWNMVIECWVTRITWKAFNFMLERNGCYKYKLTQNRNLSIYVNLHNWKMQDKIK